MKRAHPIPLSKRAFRRTGQGLVAAQWRRQLTLTWRNSPRGIGRQGGRAAAAISRNSWSPRFQLHLNVAFGSAVVTKRIGTPPFRASPISWIRSHAHLTSITTFARSLVFSEARRLTHRLHEDIGARERTTIRTSFRGEARKVSRTRLFSGQANHTLHWFRHSHATFRNRPAVKQSAQDRTKSIFRPARDSVFWIEHSHAAFRTSRVVRQSVASEAAQLEFHQNDASFTPATPRSPDLVWRIEPQRFALDAIERSIDAATSPVASFVTPSAAHFETSQAPFESAPVRALDPALMDRLAEDVMGRVERRIRIERERRGV